MPPPPLGHDHDDDQEDHVEDQHDHEDGLLVRVFMISQQIILILILRSVGAHSKRTSLKETNKRKLFSRAPAPFVLGGGLPHLERKIISLSDPYRGSDLETAFWVLLLLFLLFFHLGLSS